MLDSFLISLGAPVEGSMKLGLDLIEELVLVFEEFFESIEVVESFF